MYYKKFAQIFCLILVLLLTSTCNQSLLDQISPVTPSPTFTPAPTFAPTLFAYLTPSASLETFVPFSAWSWTDTKARTNPGDIFPEVADIPGNTELLVLGKSIGSEWIYVQLPSNEKGWVFASWVQLFGGIEYLPTIQPEDVQIVIGRVVDESGLPVNGVRISVFQFVEDYTVGNLVTTDAHGFFYSFMPVTISGEWLVSYYALACNSNKMPPGCGCPKKNCGQLNPSVNTVMLPQTSPLLFIWK